MLYFSTIEADEIDCMGKRFFCTTEDTFLLCFDDALRNTTVTVSNRIAFCPSGTFCDESSDELCDSGKVFL